ncbi:MAG TPA: DUF72 domain-containing protein [Polaromonas sp.]|uniref:DUF72 domain-containing protein n=1 Tax=Polaromonas sp. TaxID=1869339 RepID=UPI002D738711|nr:DUF72 domain-containing protein [Polaromonas sp.]HYW58265.1 DUF72 domain-containing protein [Polaromonas sp.]
MAEQPTVHASQMKIGCAGWSLPRDSWSQFPEEGTHLQRYAQRINAAEINSSFYRPHQPTTYARWAADVPADFLFSVKLPKTITHEQRLRDCGNLLDSFLPQAGGLGNKLGCLLVQLPPSLVLGEKIAQTFFKALRVRHEGAVALEPRHASWFTPAADQLLQHWCIARVLADPVLHDPGRWPGGWADMVYLRLHGSPRMYYSSYGDGVLRALADRMQMAAAEGKRVWCIFDNTASGAATHNALELGQLLRKP